MSYSGHQYHQTHATNITNQGLSQQNPQIFPYVPPTENQIQNELQNSSIVKFNKKFSIMIIFQGR